MSSSTTSPPFNWSFHAIAGAYGLALLPNLVYTVHLTHATKNQQSIAMPRTNLDAWKGKLPDQVWKTLVRTRGAHLNAMEVFPLFAVAVLAGNFAGLPAKEMNDLSLAYMASRVAHMAVYRIVANDTLAYLRTGVYAWSISIPIMGLIHAGRAMSQA